MTTLIYVGAYVVGCGIGGHVFVAWWMWFIRRVCLEKRDKFLNKVREGSVLFIGVTERAVALTLIVWTPSYLPAFVGGWVALKFALGWQRAPPDVAKESLLALIGTPSLPRGSRGAVAFRALPADGAGGSCW
jgi:hypothetical protein